MALEGGQGLLDLGGYGWLVGGHERGQEPVVEFGEVGTFGGSGADHVIWLVGASCAGVWLLSARMDCVVITGY